MEGLPTTYFARGHISSEYGSHGEVTSTSDARSESQSFKKEGYLPESRIGSYKQIFAIKQATKAETISRLSSMRHGKNTHAAVNSCTETLWNFCDFGWVKGA